MESPPFWIVDAFVEGPFAGNPAAVVLLDGPRDDARRAAVARVEISGRARTARSGSLR